MVYTGHVKPVNKIIAAGKPLVQELKVQTETTMYPGRLVIKGTTDNDVIVATAAAVNPGGWLGYEQTAPAFRPSTPSDMYAADDMVAVLNGGGFIIVGTLAASEAIAKGAALECGAAGTLQALSGGILVAYAEESVTDSGSGTANIMVRSVI